MKMLHVTIQTKNFEEEINFFIKHAGLEIVQEMHGSGRNMVFLANAANETSIEIIEKPEADNSGNENISIGFKTDDVEKKRDELIIEGYNVTSMISPMPNIKFFFVKDPSGVTIQFM